MSFKRIIISFKIGENTASNSIKAIIGIEN